MDPAAVFLVAVIGAGLSYAPGVRKLTDYIVASAKRAAMDSFTKEESGRSLPPNPPTDPGLCT